VSSVLILTIGHSTRTLEGFLDILRAHSVTRIVDIRTIPRSRHNPQFNQESLSESLKESGHRLHSNEATGWLASSQGRFPEHGLEELLLQRIRGLHANARIRGGHRPTGWASSRRSGCHHVCRGSALAMPSVVDRWCTMGPRTSGRTHHDDQNSIQTHIDKMGSCRRYTDYLSRGALSGFICNT